MKKPAEEHTSSVDDVPHSAGGAALGARLRRLSALIDREAGAIYASRGFDFEQRWFGVVQHLHAVGASSVAQLAKCLGVTHVAVSQTRKALEERGLIESTADPEDARRSMLSLSVQGKQLAASLQPTWDALSAAAAELNAEANNVVEALAQLEQALLRRGLGERVTAQLALSEVARGKTYPGTFGPRIG